MADSWTTMSVLQWTTQRFEQAGLDNPRLDAEVLVAHGLGCERVALYTQFDKPLKPEELGAVRELIRRRLAGEPVAYLTGQREFWSMRFEVDPRVLIPRPDTETVIETVLSLVPDRQRDLDILDLGTGSGALAVALARELPASRIVATDISVEAAEVARKNIERLGFAARVRVEVGDLFAALSPGQRFDGIVSNPPYVTTAELEELSAEVRREPRLALDGGPEGVTVLARLINEAPKWLAPGGWLVLEHGYKQSELVQSLLASAGLQAVQTRADLGGNPRVTSGRISC